jgi:pantetheine-phosphate adenylyltransferase
VTIALVVGSFDPLIQGQADLIRRVADIAERVIVAVEETPGHPFLYTLQERLQRARQGLAGLPKVEVRPYNGNLGNLVVETHATAYGVALRSGSDVDYVLATLQPICTAHGLELIALLAEPSHAFVTTALVRDVARLGGDITPFVP